MITATAEQETTKMRKTRTAGDSIMPEAWLPILQTKVRPPTCVVMGSPRQVVEVVQRAAMEQPIVYQMDLHQAERIREILNERQLSANVQTLPDPWDVPGSFESVIFPVEPRGERMLKLDVIEQAYHLLKPQGTLIVLSRLEKDDFFPAAL